MSNTNQTSPPHITIAAAPSDAIQRLRDAGATRIVVKPDGSVEGEFGQQPCLLPHYPQQPWWPWGPAQPYWWGTTIGDTAGLGESASTIQFPGITWAVES